MIATETPIEKNRHIATISKLAKEYSVQLEVMITHLPIEEHYNVLHLTTGVNTGEYGCRIPAVWIHSTGHILIASRVNGQWSFNYCYPPSLVTLNKWIRIKVSQAKTGEHYLYSIEVNGEVMLKANNTTPEEFEKVKVYASDPWYIAQQGYIRRLSIGGNVIFSLITYSRVRKCWKNSRKQISVARWLGSSAAC